MEVATATEADAGATVKLLCRLADGLTVETVAMETGAKRGARRRSTVCVSSQVGCAVGCPFCATGHMGLRRSCTAAEIVDQVRVAAAALHRRDLGPVTHVVYMGMGEPLANYDATWASVERLHGDLGLSARHITVSTVGVVPGMLRLARERLPVTLAVSLHAPDDGLREQLVPLNRRYPIADVLDAARAYADRKGRRVTFEYACIDGVNDAPDQADVLAARLTGMRGGAHVNLIPLNSTSGYGGRPAVRDRIEAFAHRLRERGVEASVRRNRGVSIDAACGQLRARSGRGPTGTGRSARMTP